MLATRAARRRGAAYAILVAASVLLLAGGGTPPLQGLRRGVGFALAPIQGALAGATRSVTSAFGALGDIERLQAQNAQLQAQNRQLLDESLQVQEIRHQNDALTALLQVRSLLSYTTVTATVIGRGVAPNERVATLDVGSSKGVAVGDVVVAAGSALVGRVEDVGPDYSRILLLNDPRLTVVGMTEVSRALGQVQGQLGASLAMTQIPSTDTVAVNETVVTAGIALGDCIRSPYPKGLLIGRVVSVEHDPSAVVQTALLEPAAALDQLEYVLVVTDYQGGLINGGAGCSSGGASPGAAPGGAAAPSPTARPRAGRSPAASPTPSPGLILPSPSLGGGG